MLKKIIVCENNISSGVNFLIRGAKKRRSMAILSAKMISSEKGIQSRLFAVK